MTDVCLTRRPSPVTWLRTYTATQCGHTLQPGQDRKRRYCDQCLKLPHIAAAERERVRSRARRSQQRARQRAD